MCFFWLIILDTWLLWCMLCSSEKNAPVYIYGAASVVFLCVHPHLFVYCTWPAATVFFLDLFPMLQDELVLTYRTVSPSSGCLCWLLFLSPVFSLVEWQEPACSCGKEMMGWWQTWPISESCCVSQDEQVAMVYLPMQLGKALPLTALPFSEMFGFTSGSASIPVCAIAKNIPWVPLLHCASQISYLSCWCTFPDALPDQALAYVPQWYKSELSWEDSLLPE